MEVTIKAFTHHQLNPVDLQEPIPTVLPRYLQHALKSDDVSVRCDAVNMLSRLLCPGEPHCVHYLSYMDNDQFRTKMVNRPTMQLSWFAQVSIRGECWSYPKLTICKASPTRNSSHSWLNFRSRTPKRS